MDNMDLVIATAWAVLTIVGRWLLFRKAGKPGWHSIVPFVNGFQEFSIAWKGGKYFLYLLLVFVATAGATAAQEFPVLMGIAAAAVLGVFVIQWKQSMKLARAFGRGAGTGLLLFLTNKLGLVILGLGKAEYVGKEPERYTAVRAAA